VRMTALGLLAALALSGCGETEGVAAPQRENANRADQICESTQDQVGTLADDAGKDRDLVRAAAERFAALDAPSENETIWQRFIRESENLWLALEDVAQARDPAVNERARADRALTRVRETNTRLAELGEKYSMQVCNAGLGRNP
jgi:DNA repair ATPase RecN